MKPELLCPAGNIKSLKAAIHNGADAVYLSGKFFGARKFAENFTNDEIIEAIKYAHIYDVKVYVTANTIIFEDEVDNFVNYIKFLYLNGVDAVLMQDIGMISLIRKIIPDLEIHASTQTHNCNEDVLKLFKDLGVKRVVLARELSLKEINSFKTDIEKEIFIHGALCICYSGCCLFSSLNGGRSGNRGECAGPCRLSYVLIKDGKEIKTNGKYLLSTKELNTSKKIKEILNSNVHSLKIEGRMKSPEYVGFVTKMYRKLIDENYIDEKNEEDLKKLFNREFTFGHLFEDNILNTKSPNHIGIKIGKVIDINKKIKIKLNNDISQNDGIRFKESNKGMIINKLYNNKGLLINKAYKGDIVFLDNKINLNSFDEILKTTDYLLLNNLKNYDKKKIFVSIEVEAITGKKLFVRFRNNNYEVSTYGNIVQKSITSPISKEKIITQLSKLGNTPFTINKVNINMSDNIFIPVSELNEIRRSLVAKLIGLKTKVNRKISNIKLPNCTKEKKEDFIISASVCNEKQLKILINKIDNIYTDNYNLYLKYKDKNVFYKTNRTEFNLKNFKNENLLLTNLGDFYKYPKDNICHGDYFFNIVNSYSAKFLLNKCNVVTLSPELSLNRIKDIALKINNLEVIIYGTLDLMIIKKSIIKNYNYNSKYFLKNIHNELFPIFFKNNQTHIMNHTKINLLNKINYLKEIGINNFRLEFFDETEEQILDILDKMKRTLI